MKEDKTRVQLILRLHELGVAVTGVSPLAMCTNSLTEEVTECVLVRRVARTHEVKR